MELLGLGDVAGGGEGLSARSLDPLDDRVEPSVRRAASTTRAPRSANASAAASPIPDDAPATTTTALSMRRTNPLVRWWCLGRYRSPRRSSPGARRALGAAAVSARGVGASARGRRGGGTGGSSTPQRVREHPETRGARSRQALRAVGYAGALRLRRHRADVAGVGRADRRAGDRRIARHRRGVRRRRVRAGGGAFGGRRAPPERVLFATGHPGDLDPLYGAMAELAAVRGARSCDPPTARPGSTITSARSGRSRITAPSAWSPTGSGLGTPTGRRRCAGCWPTSGRIS